MSNGLNACTQSARGVNQSSPTLVGGFATRTLGILKRVWMRDLIVRSNSSKSNGLKSRPRSCPYALVA